MRLPLHIRGLILAFASSAFGVDATEHLQNVVLYSGSVAGTEVQVTASCRPFKRSNHKVTEATDVSTEANPDGWPTIDGMRVLGTNGGLPKEGDCLLPKFLHHVVKPNLGLATFEGRPDGNPSSAPKPGEHWNVYVGTLIAFSADAKAVFISLGLADASAGNTFSLFVTDKGVVTHGWPMRPGDSI
jgi:hypothetical protein